MKQLIRLIALLLAFPIAVFSINWLADPANIMRTEYEQTVVDILLSGKNAANVENMDDRRFLRLYTQQSNRPIDTLVLGSSRAMQVTPAVTGDANTFSAGVTGSDLRDVISGYFMFRDAGFAPQTVVLSLEYWYLAEREMDNRANVAGYEAFCAQQGLTPKKTESADKNAMREFFSFPYFQASVSYLLANGLTHDLPTPTEDVWAETPVRRTDGSYGYARAYREQTAEWIERDASDRTIALTEEIAKRVTPLDKALQQQLEAFVRYLQSEGVTVRLLLSPVHPVFYNGMQQNATRFGYVFETEQWYRQLADRCGLPLYGSFDPNVLGVTGNDFFDGIHPIEDAVIRYYDRIV